MSASKGAGAASSAPSGTVGGRPPRYPGLEEYGRVVILAERRDRALRALSAENALLRAEVERLRARVVELGGVSSD